MWPTPWATSDAAVKRPRMCSAGGSPTATRTSDRRPRRHSRSSPPNHTRSDAAVAAHGTFAYAGADSCAADSRLAARRTFSVGGSMRRNIFGRYLSALAEGDPVALGVTGLFVVILIAVGLVAWKSKRE